MTAHRTVKELRAADAAYIAGLIDGEGSITLTRRHSSDQRQLVVAISNTEHALLAFVQTIVGAGRITSKARYCEHHSASYAYAISNRQALKLLRQIEPYLRSYKSRRAKLVLKDYVRLTPRNGKYTRDTLKARTRFITRFHAMTAHGQRQRRLIER